MISTRRLITSCLFAVAAAGIVLVGLRCHQESRQSFDALVERGKALGLTPVPSRLLGPTAIWLVRDPAAFIEPTNILPRPLAPGAVRLARVVPGTRTGDVPDLWSSGGCELMGDPELIRQLLER